MTLWLCLRFDQLPLQCLERGGQGPAVVLEERRVLRASDSAAALGIRPGMGAATARALAEPETLRLLERDPAAERRCLAQLCGWAYSISPSLYPWRGDCILLEVGSCLTLHRGLLPLLAEVDSNLACRGHVAHSALAATPRAAWLLSHTDGEPALAWERDLAQRLGPLPLALLAPEFPREVASLRRAGLRRLGDVLALPPASLVRRCGAAFNQWLRRALGQEADLQPHFQPPATFSDSYWFGYEVRANAELLPAVQLLLQSLCRFLANTQLCSGEIRWQLVGVDGELRDLVVRSDSSRGDWESWYQLTRIHLEQLALRAGVEGLGLYCDRLRPGEADPGDLFRGAGQREPPGSLLDRLRGRLGRQAVQRVACRDEHLPELALRVGTGAPGEPGCAEHCSQRPFWLMPRPQPLGQLGQQLTWEGPLTLLHGPERIEDHWWRQPVSRDYYIARGDAGQLFWVFRDRRRRQWYVHGVFA